MLHRCYSLCKFFTTKLLSTILKSCSYTLIDWKKKEIYMYNCLKIYINEKDKCVTSLPDACWTTYCKQWLSDWLTSHVDHVAVLDGLYEGGGVQIPHSGCHHVLCFRPILQHTPQVTSAHGTATGSCRRVTRSHTSCRVTVSWVMEPSGHSVS